MTVGSVVNGLPWFLLPGPSTGSGDGGLPYLLVPDIPGYVAVPLVAGAEACMGGVLLADESMPTKAGVAVPTSAMVAV